MAKLKAPLLSLGASGAIGKSIVYFPWKGLNVAREYVVPANPQSTEQNTQRGYMTDVVAAIHTAQGLAARPLAEDDITALALWGSTFPTPRTWFNQLVKNWIDQNVHSLKMSIIHGLWITPGNTQILLSLNQTEQGANQVTDGRFYYGTSKTALINYIDSTNVGAGEHTGTITGLTNGIKYYVQFRPTAHADFVGVRSGIYHATPSV